MAARRRVPGDPCGTPGWPGCDGRGDQIAQERWGASASESVCGAVPGQSEEVCRCPCQNLHRTKIVVDRHAVLFGLISTLDTLGQKVQSAPPVGHRGQEAGVTETGCETLPE